MAFHGTDANGPESEQARYRAALTTATSAYLDSQRHLLRTISPDTHTLIDTVETLTRGGKKLRPLLCYWGWRGAGGPADSPEIVAAGVALELFQAAALIHDDIIDRSATRRGAPSVHEQFGSLHARSGWHLNADRFGISAAILAGDLCLSLSEEQFASIGPKAAHGTAGRGIFNRMRTEVMAGQYLDLLEEAVGPGQSPEAAAARAHNILRYKSAKYSTEHPLCLGGALAGAGKDQLAAYSEFSLPLGEAFQLRDDILGVFGDPAVTGKPAGDDLREGKRTVLVARALETGSSADRKVINRALGNDQLNPGDVERLRGIITATGALEFTESLILQLSQSAFDTLDRLEVDSTCRTALALLATSAVTRSS
ncbi:polyprenyl synthetase family protein [Arthrobacter sp. H5]|uniref:polyprenyl synthetase family protein n=1 Tax=Arthrobacter sp. H5 TaxID=1267973 RepID=UPI0004857156|nr:polyprenyl synthetase family protein [Arthrobacter sp. H5]